MNRRSIILAALAIVLLVMAGLLRHFTSDHTKPKTAGSVLALPPFDAPAPPRNPAQQLRPPVIRALGYAPDIPWDERLALIRRLPGDLTPDETAALLTALMERCPPEVSTAVHSSYMHEISCILQTIPAVRERFAQALASLARDLHRDATTRDYAIQHLRQAWERARDDAALQTSIVTTFRDFTALDSAVATAALLSLHMLGSSPTEDAQSQPLVGRTQASHPPLTARGSFYLPDGEIAPLLIPIFANKTTADNIAARLTAARIVGERRLADFRPTILAQLTNSSEHALIRMAAAHALGCIAHPDDMAALATYNPHDDRVATALRFSLGHRYAP